MMDSSQKALIQLPGMFCRNLTSLLAVGFDQKQKDLPNHSALA